MAVCFVATSTCNARVAMVKCKSQKQTPEPRSLATCRPRIPPTRRKAPSLTPKNIPCSHHDSARLKGTAARALNTHRVQQSKLPQAQAFVFNAKWGYEHRFDFSLLTLLSLACAVLSSHQAFGVRPDTAGLTNEGRMMRGGNISSSIRAISGYRQS